VALNQEPGALKDSKSNLRSAGLAVAEKESGVAGRILVARRSLSQTGSFHVEPLNCYQLPTTNYQLPTTGSWLLAPGSWLLNSLLGYFADHRVRRVEDISQVVFHTLSQEQAGAGRI
jgi:hypothetical protein